MENLPTLLTVALVCAALGFLAGSMLTSIWINRHSKPMKTKRTSVERNEKEFARILLDSNGIPTDVEINGEVYSSSRRPDNKTLVKLKKTEELFSQLFQNTKKGIGNVELDRNAGKISRKKDPGKDAEKTVEHDMLFEINNIIQEKLRNSSTIHSMIRLAREGATGVLFWVDDTSYQTLEVIPDNQVKALIKEAVAEWEAHVG